MQTADQVGKDVPIREGDYGEKVATVEPGGVEYIALRERHGKPLDLFWTWLSADLEFATVFIGVIPVAFEGLHLLRAAPPRLLGPGPGARRQPLPPSGGPQVGLPLNLLGPR